MVKEVFEGTYGMIQWFHSSFWMTVVHSNIIKLRKDGAGEEGSKLLFHLHKGQSLTNCH